MALVFKAGHPSIFSPELVDQLIAAVHDVLVKRHVAGLCGIHYNTLNNWLNQGQADHDQGLWTEYVRLLYGVKIAQAQEIKIGIKEIKERLTNWQARAWILERCFREDFGADAGIVQELLEKQQKMEDDLKRFTANPLQGVVTNAKEMDIKSD